MEDFLSIFAKNPLVEGVEIFSFQETISLQEGWPDKAVQHCKSLSEKVQVASFRYRSSQGKVKGYCVAPLDYTDKLPCIIFNRGGFRENGKLASRSIFGYMALIASWGYCVIGSQYAGNDGGEGVDEFGGQDVEDVLKLRDVLAQSSFADSTRIGMLAISRGAVNAYLALQKADWIKALVTQAGLVDLVKMTENRPEMNDIFKSAFGGDKEGMEKRSASYQVQILPKNVPILILHGACDWRVQPSTSIELSLQFLNAQIPHRLVIYEGADHDLHPRGTEKNQEIKKWFERFVMNNEQAPKTEPFGQ